MAKVFYVHWNAAELQERLAPLQKAGYEMIAHWNSAEPAKFGEMLPDAVVISLERLPSHGRAIAEWFDEAKKRQHIPIIFAGGQPDKVQAMKAKFPKATFCATEATSTVLEQLLKTRAVSPSKV